MKKKKFKKSLKKFLVKIIQLPPVKSAFKREERKREIYDLKSLNWRYARIFCSVESGTYIRKLAHDLGEEMGVRTSMRDFERISVGVFSKKNSRIISLKNLEGLFFHFSECKRCWIKFFFIILP